MSQNMDGNMAYILIGVPLQLDLYIYGNAMISTYHCQAEVCSIFYDDTNDRTCYLDLNQANDLKSLT